MRIHKFSDSPAFVALDLAGAPATGIVRHANKILQGGAKDLARVVTYSYASLGLRVGGASAGISAAPEDRDSAVATFVTELATQSPPLFLADAGKGVSASDLTALESADPRHPGLTAHHDAINAAGIVGALEVALETLAGKTFSCDTPWATSVVAAMIAAGASQVPDDNAYAAGADVLLVGAKTGAIDHVVAEAVRATTICPIAPLPLTAKGFAVLRRAGAVALPDFVTLAAPLAAAYANHSLDATDLPTHGANAVRNILSDVMAHPEGPLLGACYRAETFLETWQDQLPFGRPFAA